MEQIKLIIPLLGVLVGFLLSNWQRKISENNRIIEDFILSVENYSLGKIEKNILARKYFLLPKSIKKKISVIKIMESNPDELQSNCLELIEEVSNV